MIVTCDRCASQFQLDESKVPTGGAKVRCSRCQHAFVVLSPHQTEADLAETWVRETLSRGDDELAPAALDPTESVESDWEFNDAPGIGDSPAEPELEAAREAVDSLLDGVPSRPSDTPPTDVEPPDLEIDTGSEEIADVFADEFVDAPEDGIADGFGAAFEDELDEGFDALSADSESVLLSDESDIADPVGEDLRPPAAENGDLGEPSKWNFFDEEGADTTYAEVPPPEEAQTRVESPSAGQAPLGFDQQLLVGMPSASDAADESGWVSRVGELSGWGIVAVLVAACLFGGLGASAPEGVPLAATWSGAGFDLEQVRGRWVDNASVGPVFVVSGRIRRGEGSSPWEAVPLSVELLDPAGRSIEGARSAVGPEIPPRYLHESRPSELEALQSKRARQFAAFAGTWLQFDAIFSAVPTSTAGFAFVSEASESSKVSEAHRTPGL